MAHSAEHSVRSLMNWIRQGQTIRTQIPSEPQAEDLWTLFIDDVDPGLDGAWHQRFWCGRAIFMGDRCPFGRDCKHIHPQHRLRLCGSTQPQRIKKLLPTRRIPLADAIDVAYERIMFVEHVHAGVIWSKLFTRLHNRKLMFAYLRSGSACGHPCASLDSPSMSQIVPETCWNRIADFAGPGCAIMLRVALGSGVGWTAWLHNALGFPAQERSSEPVASRSLHGEGRATCSACLHGSGTEHMKRCFSCGAFLCGRSCFPPCARGTKHECSARPFMCELSIVGDIGSQAEHLGSIVGAAAECAALAGLVHMDPRPHLRNAAITMPQSGRGSSLSDIVAQCGEEGPSLLPHREINCDADILAARMSDRLLAVQTASHLKVIRREDWKTVQMLPAAPLADSQEATLEILEAQSRVIAIAASGLQIFDLLSTARARPTVIFSSQGEWDLQTLDHDRLLASAVGGVCLRDLNHPELQVVRRWACQPLCLTSTGAVVSDLEDRTRLCWLDPRQPELVSLPAMGGGSRQWTAAAQRPTCVGPLALGAATGELVAVDLRESSRLLWSLCPTAPKSMAPQRPRLGGPVQKLYASPHLLLARTSLLVSDAAADLTGVASSCLHAASWYGTSLAVLAGAQAITSGRCGQTAYSLGQRLIVVGAPAEQRTSQRTGGHISRGRSSPAVTTNGMPPVSEPANSRRQHGVQRDGGRRRLAMGNRRGATAR